MQRQLKEASFVFIDLFFKKSGNSQEVSPNSGLLGLRPVVTVCVVSQSFSVRTIQPTYCAQNTGLLYMFRFYVLLQIGFLF